MPNTSCASSQRELTFDEEPHQDICVTSFANNAAATQSNSSSVLVGVASPKAAPRDTFGGGVGDYQGFATSFFHQ